MRNILLISILFLFVSCDTIVSSYKNSALNIVNNDTMIVIDSKNIFLKQDTIWINIYDGKILNDSYYKYFKYRIDIQKTFDKINYNSAKVQYEKDGYFVLLKTYDELVLDFGNRWYYNRDVMKGCNYSTYDFFFLGTVINNSIYENNLKENKKDKYYQYYTENGHSIHISLNMIKVITISPDEYYYKNAHQINNEDNVYKNNENNFINYINF